MSRGKRRRPRRRTHQRGGIIPLILMAGKAIASSAVSSGAKYGVKKALEKRKKKKKSSSTKHDVRGRASNPPSLGTIKTRHLVQKVHQMLYNPSCHPNADDNDESNEGVFSRSSFPLPSLSARRQRWEPLVAARATVPKKLSTRPRARKKNSVQPN